MCRLRKKFHVPGWSFVVQLGALAWLGLNAATTALAQPANTNFANATILAGDFGSQADNNDGVTNGPLWYSWTADADGVLTLDTYGSDFDTVLSIYTDGFFPLAQNDDYLGERSSKVSIVVASGNTYPIAVSGYNGATGDIALNWDFEPLPANDNFANATVLDNTQMSGSLEDNNTGATAENSEPTHAGFLVNHSLWYKWTAPADGEVLVDTVGSSIDTVLAVYTGNSISTLNQVAANDDLYPTYPIAGSGQRSQRNAVGQNASTNSIPLDGYTNYVNRLPESSNNIVLGFAPFRGADFTIDQPFTGLPNVGFNGSGASGVRFNAKAGATYYIAVDGKNGNAGTFSLNWAYHPSGVFRFASENFDKTTGVPAKDGRFATTGYSGMMLYQVSESETSRRTSGSVNANQYNTTIHTTYSYDVPGLLVTVTRMAGSSGRVTVAYSTIDGDQISDHYSWDSNTNQMISDGVPIPLNGDDVAVAGFDYVPVSGVLTFDDFEMSKSFVIPIGDDYGALRPNRDFAVALADPEKDIMESPDVSDPRLDPVHFQALVRILDTDIDPLGPSRIPSPLTNYPPPLGTNSVTNTFITLEPTNAVFNFQKSNFRVPEDVGNYWGGTPITVYVNRSGTNQQARTINWRINNSFLSGVNGPDQVNNRFPLQPGSDYATPDPANQGGLLGRNPEFVSANSGTLTFPGGNNSNPQPITFTVYNNKLTKFNRDFQIELFDLDQNGNPFQVGMVAETTVTILTDDLDPAAGSVDEWYNPDYGLDLVPPVGTEPHAHPGTDLGSQVNAVVVQPDNKSIIGGNFSSYNGVQSHGLARVDSSGFLDTAFTANIGDGIVIGDGDTSVKAIGLQSDGKIIVGGYFSSFNGTPCGNLVRLNADGTLDTTFNANLGSGFNGTVRAILVRGDGTIVVGGDFTQIGTYNRRYIARLTSTGTLDSTWDSGTTFNAPVYAISPEAGTSIAVNASAGGNELENTNIVNVGASSGVLTVDYDMLSVPDDMRVFYGGTNNGVLIYDTGSVSGTGHLVIPFGPTNGLSFNYITIVMNQGNGTPGTFWSYTATVQTFAGDQLTIGGAFTSAGGISGLDRIARVLGDGSLDTTFIASVNGTVYAVTTQTDGNVVAGGEFTIANGKTVNHIARFHNTDGSLDTGFFSGTGTDQAIYHLHFVPSMTALYTNWVHQEVHTNATPDCIYVGGAFTVYNGTHRLGFGRLNLDGSLDTTFLDTAYNQFAGLPKLYFNDAPNAVFASDVQADGNVIIGGSFKQVGGGQFYSEVRTNEDTGGFLWSEPKSRAGIRNRYNVARLIGGATEGPGNVGLFNATYPSTKSQGFVFVMLMRTNGALGSASANFSVLPGTAQPVADYNYEAIAPLYPQGWNYVGPSRTHSDSLFGTNTLLSDIFGGQVSLGLNGPASVLVTVNNNTLNSGNLNAQFQLANPAGADQFYLGGENIPVGTALGRSVAPLTIVDDNKKPGTFGFSSSNYTGVTTTTITVTRTNGTFNTSPVLVDYATSAGPETTNGADYTDVNGTLTFNDGDVAKAFQVPIISSNYISAVEKTVTLQLFNIRGVAGATLGLSNSVLRIINPNFGGFLNFSATNYVANINSNYITFSVTRTVGNKGPMSVQYATYNGTALSGVDYFGSTNTLSWTNGDSSSRTVTIPLVNNGAIGGTKYFGAYLFNPTTNGVGAPAILGGLTNATLTINNDNSYGTFQFSQPSYVVNESGGYALLTVTRGTSLSNSVTVDFSTADGTAFAGTNYVATNGTLNFAAGQLAATFKVTILNDNVVNGSPFFFRATLSNPGPGTSLGATTNALVNILDASSINRPPGSTDVTFNPPTIDADILALALQTNGQIIAAGNFTHVNGLPEGHLARFNGDGSHDVNYLYGLSGANGAIYSLAYQADGRILIAGAFSQFDSVARNFVARVATDGSLDTSFNPGAGPDNAVYAVADDFVSGDHRIYIGGSFTTYRTVGHIGIARLNDNGTLDTTFTGGVNGTVYALAVYPTNSIFAGKVIAGGSFTSAGGGNQSGIARFNADGSRDSSFAVNVSGIVRAIVLQNDGAVVIGGDFTNVNGTAVANLARVNNDGSIDTAFVANLNGGANGIVTTLALQADNRIVVGGQFTQVNGVTRSRITRLLPSGAADPTINFGTGANGDVNAVLVQPADQMIVLGGGFTRYNDQPPAYLTRIYGGSQTGSGAFEFTSTLYSVNEDGVIATISVRRTGGTSGPNADGSGNVQVHFNTANGTATAGVNYIATATDVVFPPGEVLRTVSVPVLRDNLISSNLTVNLYLSSPTPPAGLGDQPTGTLTIINVDGAVSFASQAYSVAKNTPLGFAPIDVIRQGTTKGTCSVDFYTTTNGTAVPGLDYTPTNTTVVFAPGETTKTVYVAITNNAIYQGNRTIGLVLSNAVNTLLYSPSNATLTIVDTVFSPGELQFATNAYYATESDGTATITVSRVNGTSGAISAYYYTTPGTALPGVNYASISNVVNFIDGQASKTFTVQLLDPGTAHNPVTLGLGLVTNLTSGTTLSYPSNATLTISSSHSGFVFDTTTNIVRETFGPAAIAVQRVGPTNSTVSVSYATHDGTAISGTNYVGATNTLTFAPGQTSKSILIPLVYDPRVTGDLTFTTTLFGNSSGTQIGSPSTNTVVIQDGDAGLSFTNDTMTAARNIGAALITVVCSNPSVEPVVLDTNTIPLSVQYVTSDGTAKAGSDYVATSGTLVFTNGMGTNYFYVPLINVGQVVGDKTFSVRLLNPTAPGKVVAPSNLVVTITDGNAAFKFSKPTYSIYKSGGAITIDVLRTGLTNSAAQVSFTATNGTALAGVHYYPTNGTLYFTNGVTTQTFTVGVIDTAAVQPDVTVLLQLFNPSNAILLSPSAATLTIRDNSGSYVLPAGSQIVSESGPVNGVIDPSETVSMMFGFRDAGGLDVTNLSATLIASNGVTPSPNPATQGYGYLRSGSHSVSRQFTFAAAGTNGQQIQAVFQLKDGSQNIGTAVFGYTLGSWQARFTNNAAILINDKAVASPYPSLITVSNIVGTVIKATATLTNVSHTSVKDIDVLLVAPEQSDTLLMAHVGSFGTTITNATLTFDDAAPTSLPSSGTVTTGTNKPSAYLPVPTFP